MARTILTRRDMLRYSGLALGAAALTNGSAVAAPPVESIATISLLPGVYHGWPTLARRASGQLLLAYSGGREGHVCPFGRVELMRSDDNGRTWTWPQVVLDTAIDDRDAGVLETAQGTLLVTTFTSIAFEDLIPKANEASAGGGAWSQERLARWIAARDRIGAEERRRALGCWILRSTNNGQSWSEPIECLVNSPHGPTQLADGRLLYVGKQLWRDAERIGACESTDDGLTWRWLAEIPTRAGDSMDQLHELHALETADGRVIAVIRNHNQRDEHVILQTESSDGGRTWSEPRSTGVWGYPPHLLRLRDGRLVMSFGHRRAPLGNQACISEDHGRTWSPPIVISGDGTGSDLGYPSTAELVDGELLTVWYEQMPVNGVERSSKDHTLGSAVLRMARWRLS